MPEAMVIAAMDDEGWAIFKHCNSTASELADGMLVRRLGEHPCVLAIRQP